MKISIDTIEINQEDSVLYVWLGRTLSEPLLYFMIQYDFEPDEQDVSLGIDTYYIERDDQGYSCYGGIKTIDVSEESIIVRFDDYGIKKMDTEILELDLSEKPHQKLELLENLKKIFSNELLC